MTRLVLTVVRLLVTMLFVAVAVIALVIVWRHYEEDPWTRDGVVQADVVQVAADVSGLVTHVHVHDNGLVRAGDVLFQVDEERYAASLEQAKAAVASARASVESSIANVAKSRATLAYDERERARYTSLGDLVSKESRDAKITAVEVDRIAIVQAEAQLDSSRASLQQAIASRRSAEINVERSSVRAGVNGYVTGITMRPGDYVTSGGAKFALLDVNSFYVLGYFEETKLHRFSLGDRVRVDLLGDPAPLWGHVDSLSAGIADRQQNSSGNLLPNITPTFSWIRLAQRVPVRVIIDQMPANIRLVAGRTATVTVLPTAQPVGPSAVPESTVIPNTAPASRPPASPDGPAPVPATR